MQKLLLDGLLDLLSPPTCAACLTPLAARAHVFCSACGPLIESLPDGVDIGRGAQSDDRDACVYGGPLRDALHRLKYGGASSLAPPLATLLEAPARALVGRFDCVTMVPLHPRRLRERGYNQAALLARALAVRVGLPFVPWLLVRAHAAQAQVGRGLRDRKAQLAHAFQAQRSARGRACLVVDDVRTTGATLAEARRALLAGGATRVCTLALAAALPEEESG